MILKVFTRNQTTISSVSRWWTQVEDLVIKVARGKKRSIERLPTENYPEIRNLYLTSYLHRVLLSHLLFWIWNGDPISYVVIPYYSPDLLPICMWLFFEVKPRSGKRRSRRAESKVRLVPGPLITLKKQRDNQKVRATLNIISDHWRLDSRKTLSLSYRNLTRIQASKAGDLELCGGMLPRG